MAIYLCHGGVCESYVRCSCPPPPHPFWGAKMFERSQPWYKPKWRNWLAPQVLEIFGATLMAGRTGHPIY